MILIEHRHVRVIIFGWVALGTICVTDVFFVKEKGDNFQKNKIIVLLYLELREREEKNLPIYLTKTQMGILWSIFSVASILVSRNKLDWCLAYYSLPLSGSLISSHDALSPLLEM